MIFLIFLLSILVPLGHLQSVNHHDVSNPFYNTNKLSKSEPITIQTISGRIYEETKKEITTQPHDRNQNTQIREPIDCAKDFLNYRRKFSSYKEETDKPNKENQSKNKDNPSITHFNAEKERTTSTKNKILETQKKEVQFDSLIVKNNLNSDANKYEHTSKLFSNIKDDLNRPIDNNYNNYRKMYESNLISHNEERSESSTDKSFDNDTMFVHATNFSQTEAELDRSSNDDFYTDSAKYKSTPKLISQTGDDLLLNHSVDDNFYNNSKNYEPLSISQNEDHLDRTAIDNLDEDNEYVPKLIADELNHPIDDNFDSISRNENMLDSSIDENLNHYSENYEPTTKISSQTEYDLDRLTDDDFNDTLEKYDTTPGVSEEDDLDHNSTRRLMSGVYYQPVSPDDVRTPMDYNLLPIKTQGKSKEPNQRIDNSKKNHLNDVITKKIFKKTSCDDAQSRSSSKELEKEDDDTVTQVKEPTIGSGISDMNKSQVMIMHHPRVCYACSSINDPSCWFPDRRTSVKYCRKDHSSCLTKVFLQKGTRYIIRDCGSTCLPKTTFESAPVYKLCTICHNDLCNSAFSAKIQVFVIIMFVLFHLTFSH